MKTTKRITAAVAAIAVLMTLTACGSEPTSTGSVETAVNMSDIESTTSSAETSSSIKTESATQSEAVTEADPYAYLELINADYESCYDTMMHEACVVDGIAYFYAISADPNFGTISDEKGYYSYNISTGETKCIVPYEEKMKFACYAGGQIYTIVRNEARCYDLDGNLLKSYDFNDIAGITYTKDFEIQAVMADGSCVIGNNIDSKYHYLISNDFTSAKLIAETTEGVHGTTEETPYGYIIGGRGNILYVAESSMKEVFYGIDMTTGEKTEYAIPNVGQGLWADRIRLFGTEYYQCGTAIIKADTGETIATVRGSASNYYGGDYFYQPYVSDAVFAPSAQISIKKCPNNKGEAEETVLFKVDTSDVQFTILNSEYYLVTDEYGTFLRSINSEEETQIKFE